MTYSVTLFATPIPKHSIVQRVILMSSNSSECIHSQEIREQAFILLLDKVLNDSSLTEQQALEMLGIYSKATTKQILDFLYQEGK